MNSWKVGFYALILSVFISCNRYNKMVYWADNIPQGTSIDSVKKTMPSFIEIDWKNPVEMTNETWYIITKIKYSYDPMHMSNYLAFKDNKYIARFAHK